MFIYAIKCLLIFKILICTVVCENIIIKSNNNSYYSKFGLLLTNQYDFYDFTAYGNEYQQTNEYFKYTDNNLTYKQIELVAFKSYYDCFSKPMNGAILCVTLKNQIYQDINPYSTNYDNKYTNNSYIKSMDCDYSIKLVNIIHSSINYYVRFNINEYKCKSNLSLTSGSSFESYVITNTSLASCKQISYLNSYNYHIDCVILDNQIDLLNDYLCVNLTVVLKGINYDSFNEILKYDDRRQFYRILSNNQQYCSQIINRSINPSNKLILGDIWYYTGHWQSNQSTYLSKYQYNYQYYYSDDVNCELSSHNLAYKFNSKMYEIVTINSSLTFGKFPETSVSLYYSNKFKFLPIILLPYNNLSVVVSNESIRQRLSNPNNTIMFIGSSHMRYDFYAIANYLYNHTIDLSSKRLDISYNNLFNYGNTITRALYADDQADLLIDTCNKFENMKSNSINQTIVFQTGAWDLTHMTISRLLKDFPAKKLLNAMTKILTNEVKCGNLIHFIWKTSVPFPLCFLKECGNNNIDHRNNAAISAINQFYLKHLMKIKISKHIRLSIVDTYSIVKPRLILNQFQEKVCNDHYTCVWEFIYSKYTTFDPYYVNGMKSKPFIIHTAGGDAVLEMLLQALYLR